MVNYTFKELIISKDPLTKVHLACIEGSQKVIENKEYFNKHTKRIYVSKCYLSNKDFKIIDRDKEILEIKIIYSIKYFNQSERKLRAKHYIYMNNVLYKSDEGTKRLSKEIKGVLQEIKN